MIIQQIEVKTFRNIKNFKSKLGKSLNLITAPNASGKTNLLEAISLLSYGKSIKAKDQSELFHNGDLNTAINVTALTTQKEDAHEYSLVFAKENGRIRKAFFVDEDPYAYSQFVGKVITLFFTTSTIDLLSRSPASRRRFLDRMIWLISSDYRKALSRYEAALRQRNAALEHRNRAAIAPWTEAVVDAGGTIIEERNKFTTLLNTALNRVDKSLFFKFIPSVQLSNIFDEGGKFRFKALLEAASEKDFCRATTSVGPHRDDWTLLKNCPLVATTEKILNSSNHLRNKTDKTSKDNQRDLRSFGSRGEQRMGILSLFIAILKVMTQVLGYRPILLLDDLFSELDETNQAILLKLTASPNFQVIATTTPNTYEGISSLLPRTTKTIHL